MIKHILPFILVVFLLSCNSIQRGGELSDADLNRMRALKILDQGESVVKFYTEDRKQTAGNFFTNKRIASYWIDPRDKSKDEVFSAYYSDVKALDTVYYAGATYSPYVLVTKNDGTKFKVCANGKKQEIKAFFEDVIAQWKAHGRY
jgi:hypothetical protein